MDFALAGLGVFVGWIVLVVGGDLFGLLRVAPGALTRVQSGLLIFAIVGTLACGYAYLQERRTAACPPAHVKR
jgi:hypothetical protein